MPLIEQVGGVGENPEVGIDPVAGAGGSYTFTVTFQTAGTQTLTATDVTTNAIHGSETVAVTSAVKALMVSGMPSSVTAGDVVSGTITAKGASGATVVCLGSFADQVTTEWWVSRAGRLFGVRGLS